MPHASRGESPAPVRSAAHSGSGHTGAVRPASGEAPRPLTNHELYRILFDVEQTGAAQPMPEAPPPAPADPMATPQPLPEAVPGSACGASGCGTPGCTSCCEDCPPFWEHRSGVFGEFLFLHARDADVHFSTPTDALGVNRVPIDNALIADPAYDPGFRIGGQFALSCQASLVATYTWYESSVNDRATLAGGAGFLFPTLIHPNTINAASDYLLAEADYDIDFQFIDVAGKFLLRGDCETRVNGYAGFRYGNLEQDLFATYSNLGTQTVDSQIDFNGFGPRLGLEAERLVGRGCFVYGNVFANFLAGQFETEFVQLNELAPGAPEVNTGHEDDRIVSILELELGLGWRSRCGNVSGRLGYHVAGWFNTITTSEFIEAVHADNFDDATGSLTFDGLAARLEYNF
jgi:hypothetical protein